MAKLNFLLLAGWAAKLAAAKDVYLDWNITWVNASPDGFERPVIGINNQWPCPQIDVDVGDRLIVDVYNGLGNQSTGIHWHGFYQYATGVMDGTTSVTQCPIPPGSHMQYHFDVNQTGTYWYHSHNMGQYPDGLRGAFIVHDPSPPFQFDEEFTVTLSDWYHQQMPDLLNKYESPENYAAFGGNEPLPDSGLINDSSNAKIKVQPNKTYLVHIICIANWPGHAWAFDQHEMTVVEVDGTYVDPYPVGDQFLRVAPGQRMGVLIHTKNDTSQNFAVFNTMDVNMMFFYENRTIPDGYNPNVTAWLVYDEAKPLPAPPSFNDFDFVDDLVFVPVDKEALLQPVQHQIILDTFMTEINGVTRFTVNNQTYLPQDVPTLYTANTIGPELASNPEVYGQVNPFVIKGGEIVELVINNHHNNLHPWHLHGHQFQVLQRTVPDGGYFTGNYFSNVSQTPVRRDTIMVQNHGHTVLRFRADNPGVWLLHCHIEWHVESGLIATIIEAPETFPQSVRAPPNSHYQACAAYPADNSGNAAGKQGLDLAGANTQVPTEDHGAMYTKTAAAFPPASHSVSLHTSSTVPPAPKPTTSAPPVPEQPPASTNANSPPPEQPPAPTPTQQHSSPPLPEQPSPKPAGNQPAPQAPAQAPTPTAPAPQEPAPEAPATQDPVPQAPAPQAPAPEAPAPQDPVPQAPAPQEPAPEAPATQAPAPEAPAPQQPAPQVAPVYPTPHPDGGVPAPEGPVPHPVYEQPAPPHNQPVYVYSGDSQGIWPQPHTDNGHAQIGDGSDGPPTVADSHDVKGPWPNPHVDQSHAQVPDGPGNPPIVASNGDNKGPWPQPYNNDGYLEEGGHVIKTHDSGPDDLPKGYEYWEPYEHTQ
ncbi:Multicopper oxidase abr1 [Penicillium hispanicum]|uniref:Multicopper oxidase abr1 n=1 Tax=Penicillium hispanicum TaxID=1080232 RepID=UPI00254110E4|nr:Multicopper oxidase abr1 [Penicillium hispanicum]KAJ5573745.1 Multicopper oxidase abr1 [Penicillium hispanicum]